MRRFALRGAAALLCAALAPVASGQAWHELVADPAVVDLTDVAVVSDLALVGDGGWAALWTGTEVRLVPVFFPIDGPPTLGAPVVSWASAEAPRLAYDGSVLLVSRGGSDIGRLVGTDPATWTVNTTNVYGLNVADVALSDSVAVVVLGGSSFGLPVTSLSDDAGLTWAEGSLAEGFFPRVAASGQALIMFPDTLSSAQLSTDAGTTWGPLPVNLAGVVEDAVAAGPAGFFAVGAAGSWAVIPTTGLTPLEGTVGTADLVGASHSDATGWALGADGLVHQVDLADPAGPQLGALVPDLNLATGTAIAAESGGRLLVAGTDDVTGRPVILWRNRPPSVTPPADIVALPQGAATPVSAGASDPDGTEPSVFWSCDPSAGGTEASFADPALLTSVTLNDTANLCPDETETLACQVDVDDGEYLAAGPFSLRVTSIAVPPSITVEAVGPDLIHFATPVTVSFAAPGRVCDPTAVQAVVLDPGGQEVTLQGLHLDLAAGTFTFEAPPTGPDVTVYTARLSITDGAGNTDADEVTFEVLPPRPVGVVVCPEEVKTLEPASLELRPHPDVTSRIERWRWELIRDPADIRHAIATAPAPDSIDLQVTPQHCAFLPRDGRPRTFDVVATPEGPGGVGDPVSCPAPVRIVRGAATVALEDPERGAERVLRLDESGGAVALELLLQACNADLATVLWDYTGLPPELRPADTQLRDGQAAGGLLETLEAQPEDFPALIRAGTGFVRAVTIDGDGNPAPEVRIPVRFAPTDALIESLSITVDLWTPQAEVAPGELVELRGRVRSAVDLVLPDLQVDLDLAGFELVPGHSQVLGCARGAVGPVDGATGGRLQLDGLAAGCDAELALLARRSFGSAEVAVSACSWLGRALPACRGGISARPERALGCSAAPHGPGAGGAGTLGLLALAGLLLRRGRTRSRGGSSGPRDPRRPPPRHL